MTATDPIAFGQAAAHATLAQERPRLGVIRGGGESTLRQEVRERPVNVLLRVPADDMRLLLAALAAPGVNSRLTAIGRALWPQVHPSLLPPSADDAPPHGYERPVS